MAGNAIVARLQLDSKDYEKKLAQAKASTKKFSKDGGAGLTDMVGKFKTLAGAVAASKAVMETFNAVVKSSQTIGDAYTVAISQARGAVDEFVYAMANADFSGFNNGLKGIFKNAKDAAQAMDSLGNAQISFDYLTAGYKADYKTQMGIAKDKSLGLDERRAAYDAAQESLAKIGEAVGVYTDKVAAAIVANAQAKGNNIDEAFVTRENIDRVLALDISANGDAEKAALAERYKTFKALSKELKEQVKTEKYYLTLFLEGKVMERSRADFTAKMNAASAKAAELRSRLNTDDMQMAALYNAMLVKGTDEWLKGLTDLVIRADNAAAQYAELKTSSLEVANALGVAAANAAKLNAESRAANQARAAKAGGLSVPVAGVGGAATVSPLTERIEGFAPVAVFAEGSYEAYVAAREGALEYADALAVLEAQEMGAADGLMAIGDVVGSIGGLLGEGGAAWADYVGGIISAVSSALPALEALAAAQAAAAVTKTALSPWTAIGAVAAVASVAAAMANIPKFATGGVVPGNALSGDNVLIRANSGEVVLTKQQASNIGSLLGRGGEVTFKIKGDTLVGILNNHNKIASRSYGH